MLPNVPVVNLVDVKEMFATHYPNLIFSYGDLKTLKKISNVKQFVETPFVEKQVDPLSAIYEGIMPGQYVISKITLDNVGSVDSPIGFVERIIEYIDSKTAIYSILFYNNKYGLCRISLPSNQISVINSDKKVILTNANCSEYVDQDKSVVVVNRCCLFRLTNVGGAWEKKFLRSIRFEDFTEHPFML